MRVIVALMCNPDIIEVVKISIKKYMIIDQIILVVAGLIFETIAMYLFPEMFGEQMIPFYTSSLFISMIAIGRWNFKGLPVVVIMAIFPVIAGYLIRTVADMGGASIYNWRMAITNIVSLLSTLLIVLFRKISKNVDSKKNGSFTMVITFAVVVLAYLLQALTYGLITLSNPIDYLESLAVVNFGNWFFTIIIMAILRHRGIVVDVKKDLVNKRKEKELENLYYSKYRNEILDKPNEEDSSNQ